MNIMPRNCVGLCKPVKQKQQVIALEWALVGLNDFIEVTVFLDEYI